MDSAAAERTIREYDALLRENQAEEARALLSPAARERNTLADVAEVAAAFEDVAVTDVQELEATPTRVVYQVTLSVTVRPGSVGPYNPDRNARYVELVPGPGGWRVDRVATSQGE